LNDIGPELDELLKGGAKTFDSLRLENESDDPHIFFSKPRVLVKYYKLT
jgi:hypothetical protein